MVDNLIYCNDLEALKAKLKADGHYNEETNTYTTNGTLTPLKYNRNTSLSYVRNFKLDLNEYTMLENLGTYKEMESNTEKRAKYLSVHDYETPLYYTDEDGNQVEYFLPKKIGLFA